MFKCIKSSFIKQIFYHSLMEKKKKDSNDVCSSQLISVNYRLHSGSIELFRLAYTSYHAR